MADREKVIKALEMCAGTNEDAWETQSQCVLDCPFLGKGCVDSLMFDALALLKEQEPVSVYEAKISKCACGNIVNRYYHPKFCGYCGKELMWY